MLANTVKSATFSFHISRPFSSARSRFPASGYTPSCRPHHLVSCQTARSVSSLSSWAVSCGFLCCCRKLAEQSSEHAGRTPHASPSELLPCHCKPPPAPRSTLPPSPNDFTADVVSSLTSLILHCTFTRSRETEASFLVFNKGERMFLPVSPSRTGGDLRGPELQREPARPPPASLPHGLLAEQDRRLLPHQSQQGRTRASPIFESHARDSGTKNGTCMQITLIILQIMKQQATSSFKKIFPVF